MEQSTSVRLFALRVQVIQSELQRCSTLDTITWANSLALQLSSTVHVQECIWMCMFVRTS